MSPSDACIFCRILAGEAAASMVYQDSSVSAFMDTRPVNPGHMLVIPNQHASDLAGIDSAVGGQLFVVAQKLAAALRRSGLRCEGVNLYMADGRAAGQEVIHMHLHILPRFAGDGFGLRRQARLELPEREALDDAATRIRDALHA